MSGTYDPNYQTLAGIGARERGARGRALAWYWCDVFGADKKGGGGGGGGGGGKPVAPANQQAKAGTSIRTIKPWLELVAMYLERTTKAAGGGGGGGGGKPIAPANQGAKAGTFDPNYQTWLESVAMYLVRAPANGSGRTGEKGGGGGKPAAPKPPANLGAKAGTFDPNYQTLAGIGGNEVFGADKKR
ncbi:hypothetical protein OSTOST_10743 [Ostertagia ostertagi]